MNDDSQATHSPAPAASEDRDASPPAWLTRAIIGACVLVYVAMAATSGDFVSLPTPVLHAWGGNFAPSVADGEFWRPVTAIFLHAGLIHLGFNMYVLSMIGPFIERLFGPTTYALLYLLSGLSGSLASLAWHPATVGIGASGAIFGLYGALLGFLFVRRHVIPPEVLNPLLQNGLYFLGINLVLGFAIPNVDVAAHLGGAAGGFLGGLAATWPQAKTARSAWLIRNALLLLLIALVAAAVPLCLTKAARAQGQLDLALEGLNDAKPVLFKRFDELVSKHSNDQNGAAFANELEEDVLKPWQAMSARFPSLEDLPKSQQSNPMTAALYRYLQTMEDAFRLTIEAKRSGDEEVAQQANNKMREAQGLIEELRGK
jgi:membrane associated rhomboid family serine protease